MGTEALELRQLITDADIGLAYSLGMVRGVDDFGKFGRAPALTAPGDIWPNNSVYTFPIDAGQALEAVSTNAADTQEILVIGLDEAGLQKEIPVTLNGLTPVAIPGLWRAVNRAFNNNGSALLGTVSIKGTGVPNANVFAVITPDDQQTTQAPFMVPVDKVGVIRSVSAGINKAGGIGNANTCNFKIATRNPGKIFRTRFVFGVQKTGTSAVPYEIRTGIPLPPLAQVRITGTPDDEIDASARYTIELIDKALLSAEYLTKLEQS